MTEVGRTCRLATCVSVQSLAMIGLGLRLAFLHLGPHDQFREDVSKSRKWTTQIDVERGKVYDCGGEANILALDLAVKDVCADPQYIVSNKLVAPVAARLASYLDGTPVEIAARLNVPDRRYVCLQRSVHAEVTEPLSAAKVEGVFMRDKTVRYYPHREFLCHVLGFVNHERVGAAGIEQRMDKYLRGSPGMLESEKNGLRQELYWKRGRHVPALEGAGVHLTVDQYVQYIVEEALDAAMVEHHAKGAWAIVQRINTGEILALASRPAFDLNTFNDATDNDRLNRALGVVYEPGSTMKIVAFSAALNEGTVTPDVVFDCENGAWRHCKRILRDYHAYDRLTVADGLKKSSNILSAKLAVGLGSERFYEYLVDFGFGRQLGLDLPGEESGILHHVSRWSGISTSRIAIGQGIAATALQVLGAFCAIANDGTLMRPYLIDRVVAKDGMILYEGRPQTLSQPITPQTAATMRSLLARVTEDGGTGRRARIDGYPVAGKTGTAQKPVDGGYSSTDHVASFVGFLPAEAPEIGVIVVIDEPQPLHTGGVVAAPVFKAIVSQAVRYLDIPAAEPAVLAQR